MGRERDFNRHPLWLWEESANIEPTVYASLASLIFVVIGAVASELSRRCDQLIYMEVLVRSINE